MSSYLEATLQQSLNSQAKSAAPTARVKKDKAPLQDNRSQINQFPVQRQSNDVGFSTNQIEDNRLSERSNLPIQRMQNDTEASTTSRRREIELSESLNNQTEIAINPESREVQSSLGNMGLTEEQQKNAFVKTMTACFWLPFKNSSLMVLFDVFEKTPEDYAYMAYTVGSSPVMNILLKQAMKKAMTKEERTKKALVRSQKIAERITQNLYAPKTNDRNRWMRTIGSFLGVTGLITAIGAGVALAAGGPAVLGAILAGTGAISGIAATTIYAALWKVNQNRLLNLTKDTKQYIIADLIKSEDAWNIVINGISALTTTALASADIFNKTKTDDKDKRNEAERIIAIMDIVSETAISASALPLITYQTLEKYDKYADEMKKMLSEEDAEFEQQLNDLNPRKLEEVLSTEVKE
jgi:hypothetical protein